MEGGLVPDSDFARLATEWLTGLPYGATVRWGHDLATPADGVHTGWIDVFVPEACAKTGCNWLICILSPDDEDAGVADGVETVTAAQDTAIRGAWEHFDWVPGSIVQLGCHAGDDLVETAAGMVRTRPAWTTGALNAALSKWAARLAGRGDVRWVFDRDLTTSLAFTAATVAERIADGDEETFDLGDGVLVSSTAFDALLDAGPDVAADITSALKDAVVPGRT
jgi:hypothetical protein